MSKIVFGKLKLNASTWSNLKDLRQRQDDLQANPEAHLSRTERKIALMVRRKKKKLKQQTQRSDDQSQRLALTPPKSPVKTPSATALTPASPSLRVSPYKTKNESGVAYNISDEASALALARQMADQAEAQVKKLQYQLSFLQNKFESDNRKVQAEVKALVSSAQHGLAQRQLRHVVAISEVRRVHRHQREYSLNLDLEKRGISGSDTVSDTCVRDEAFPGVDNDFVMQPQNSLPENLTWSSYMVTGVLPKGFTM